MNSFYKILGSPLMVFMLVWGGQPANIENPLPENKVPISVESNVRRLKA